MRVYRWKSAIASVGMTLCIAMLLCAAPVPLHPQAAQTATHEIALALDPAQSKVHFNVDSTLHMVHGTFALKSGSFQFGTQTRNGNSLIVVNAVGGATGKN